MARPLRLLGIKKVEHLAFQLGTTVEILKQFAKLDFKKYWANTFKDKKGKAREGMVPVARFRPIADNILKLLRRQMLPNALHGGRQGRSIRTNAAAHLGKPVVMNIDIKSFYPSISPKMVYNALISTCGFSPDVAGIMTKLVTVGHQLPQGSPPSSIIAAMVSIPMARRLEILAVQHGADYTQYVDDITLSGPEHLRKLMPLIERIILTSGFTPHPTKKTIFGKNEEQLVTGIRVNFHLDAPISMYEEVSDSIDSILAGALSRECIPSIRGKIEYIRQFNPGSASFLGKKLGRIS